MHELVLVANLFKLLEKIKKENKGSVSFIKVNITVNPYSCIDEENLNFIFKSSSSGNPVYERAEICIKRGKDPSSREFIIDNVEIEQEDEKG